MNNENKLNLIEISKKVENLVYDKKIEEALNVIKPAISYIEKIENVSDNEASYTFDSAIEFVAYIVYLKNDKKDTKWSSEIYSRIYTQYGYLLIEKNQLDLAHRMLKNALKFNPMSIGAYFELSSIALKQNNLQQYYDYTLKAGKRCLTFKGIAKYFRNLGYYYIQKKEYKLAICLYNISLIYDKNNYALSQLDYIKSILKDQFVIPEYKECFDYAKEKEVDILPNIKLLGKLYGFADNQINNKNANLLLIKDIYKLVYDFVLDDEILPKIKKIEELLKNKQESKKENIIENIDYNNGKIENKQEKIVINSDKIVIDNNNPNIIENKDENKNDKEIKIQIVNNEKENINIVNESSKKEYTLEQASKKLLDRLNIANRLMLSSALEIIMLDLKILLSRKEKKNITVNDFKKTLNVLMMNTYKTFTTTYNNMSNEILNDLDKYYNMNEEVQTEVIGNILFGLRKIKEDEKIF